MKSVNSVRNFVTSYVIYIFLVVLGIFKVRVFLNTLGPDPYALNQLYINLYSYLALAESGVGVALIYRFYPKLSSGDTDSLNALYRGGSMIFRGIAGGVLGVGLVGSLLIPFLLKSNPFEWTYISMTFTLFVLRGVVEYFALVPRLLIQADQKAYTINVAVFGSRFIIILCEIGLLAMGLDYAYSLIPGIFFTLMLNLWIMNYAHRHYPWLTRKGPQDFSVFKDTKHLIVHKVLMLITKNSDVVVISALLGSIPLTIYAAYNYFVKFAFDTFDHIFAAVKDAIGSAFAESNPNTAALIREYFSIYNFLAISAIAMLYLNTHPFVRLWIGAQYRIDEVSYVLFMGVVAVGAMRYTYDIYRTALGKFVEIKRIAILQTILNVLFSLGLVTILGMKGVLIGTLLAFLLTDFWFYPIRILRLTQAQSLGRYYLTLLLNGVVLGVILVVSQKSLMLVFGPQNQLGWGAWILYGISSGLLVGGLGLGLSWWLFEPLRSVVKKVVRPVIARWVSS